MPVRLLALGAILLGQSKLMVAQATQASNIVVNVVIALPGAIQQVLTPTIVPSGGSYAAGQLIALSDDTAGAVIHYTTDGSTPTAASQAYSAPLKLMADETVRAVAIAGGVASAVTGGSFAVAAPRLVFSAQPGDGVVGTSLVPVPSVSIVDADGALLGDQAVPITLTLSGAGTLLGTNTVTASGGKALFSGLSVSAAGAADRLTASSPGFVSAESAVFNMAAATGITLTLPTTSINQESRQLGTVALSQPAPAGGATVQLTTSAPDAVFLLPALATIPAGETSASFTYSGLAAGASTLTATSTGYPASSVPVAVLPASNTAYASPITITKGGTYTGRWKSDDPSTPAVTVNTDQPVIIKDSVVTGPGSLIWANSGGPLGIHLQVTNVIGVALDPNLSGRARGNFVTVTGGTSVQVDHSTMVGINCGVAIANSTLTYLEILGNRSLNADDRASDGKGGILTERPQYGHTIILADVVTPNGADISWNEFINEPGKASVEDMISVYNSQGGSAAAPIKIHDNYLQGALTTPGMGYSGGGIITDGAGAGSESVPAFVDMDHNQVVQTENYGLAIAAGHDVTVEQNRVISSGKTPSGTWLEIPGFGTPVAYYLWNTYKSATFYNNKLSGNTGGLIRPDVNGTAVRSDTLLTSVSALLSNVATTNTFLLSPTGTLAPTFADEQNEFSSWLLKLQSASETVGAATTLQP